MGKVLSDFSYHTQQLLFSKKPVMTIPGLEQAEIPPQGELGMAGVYPDGLRDPEKVLCDFSYHSQQLLFSKESCNDYSWP